MITLFTNKFARWSTLTLLSFVTACASDHSGDAATEHVEGAPSALFDAPTMNETASLALNVAQVHTWQAPDWWEHCGLIIRKANGQFRATSPVTSKLYNFCATGPVTPAAGEKIVGYYHSHPIGIELGFSEKDKLEARRKELVYFVISSDNCKRRYDWQTGKTTVLGCG